MFLIRQTFRPRLVQLAVGLAALALGCGDSSSGPANHDATSTVGDASQVQPDTGAAAAEAGQPDATPRPDLAPDTGVGPTKVGDPCNSTTSCPTGGSGAATCRASWPGGYCLIEGCTAHGHDCPGDPGITGTTGESKCVLEANTSTCLKLCGPAGSCRPDYACEKRADSAGHGQADVCVPKP